MRYGLTGSIGSGKSTALNCFAQLGFVTLSADALCHEVYQIHEKKLIEAFSQRWTRNVLNTNGLINRGVLAEIVFADENELEFMNHLLHPLIEAELEKRCNEFSNETQMMVEIPLLFEKNWAYKFAKTICVWSPEAMVYERLIQRGMTESDILGRQNAQLSPEEKLARADFGLINHGDEAFLFEQCRTLAKQLH